MIRIGLTGVSGSGKSYVTKIFAKYGVPSINSDAIVHELYSSKNPCTEEIVCLFGDGVLLFDHSVNRKELASIVFASREKLLLLNQTVHPFVLDRINKIAEEKERHGVRAFLIEAIKYGLNDLLRVTGLLRRWQKNVFATNIVTRFFESILIFVLKTMGSTIWKNKCALF